MRKISSSSGAGPKAARQKKEAQWPTISRVLFQNGYTVVRLHSPEAGADFEAQSGHDHPRILVRIQTRLYFAKQFQRQGLWLCFVGDGEVYLYPHDQVLEFIQKDGRILVGTRSWEDQGIYHFPRIPQWLRPALSPYRISPKSQSNV